MKAHAKEKLGEVVCLSMMEAKARKIHTRFSFVIVSVRMVLVKESSSQRVGSEIRQKTAEWKPKTISAPKGGSFDQGLLSRRESCILWFSWLFRKIRNDSTLIGNGQVSLIFGVPNFCPFSPRLVP